MTLQLKDMDPASRRALTWSVVMHLLLAILVFSGWSWTSEHEPTLKPRSMSARLVEVAPTEPPQKAASPKPAKKPEPVSKPEPKPEPEPKPAPEKPKPDEQKAMKEAEAKQQVKRETEAKKKALLKKQEEQKKKDDAKKKADAEKARLDEKKKADEKKKSEEKADAERRRQQENILKNALELAEKERNAREQRLADQAKRAATDDAARASRDAADLTEEERYAALIKDKVERAWYNRGFSDGLSTVVRLILLPSGELRDVVLLQSSGNDAFDNSVLSAVRKVDRYPVPSDGRLFEKSFRQFRLTFSPKEF